MIRVPSAAPTPLLVGAATDLVTCGRRYHERSSDNLSAIEMCDCQTFATGRCFKCAAAVCGDHSVQVDGRRHCLGCARHIHELAAEQRRHAYEQARVETWRRAIDVITSQPPLGVSVGELHVVYKNRGAKFKIKRQSWIESGRTRGWAVGYLDRPSSITPDETWADHQILTVELDIVSLDWRATPKPITEYRVRAFTASCCWRTNSLGDRFLRRRSRMRST